MEDSPIMRCWIHNDLKVELSQWQNLMNDLSIRETHYPIKGLTHLPITSKLCAKILQKVRKSLKKEDFKIIKDKKTKVLKIIIIFRDRKGDNNNLKIRLQKEKGLKKNEMYFC